MPSFLASLLRPELAELAPYTPHSGFFPIRLDANEAPPLLSNASRARLAEVAGQTAWERYPDASAGELKAALAARSGVTPEQVLVGAGSDEIIGMLLTALSQPRKHSDCPVVVTTTPTFVMYRLSARARGQRVLEVPLDDAWDLALPSIQSALHLAEPNLIFIASPNNPTGNCMSFERLASLAALAKDSLLVVDEAYADYAEGHLLALYREHENVVLMRTLSKIGFAALRVGWLIARPELVRELEKVRLPYNISAMSQKLASIAVTELASDIARVTALVVAERVRLSAALGQLPGVLVTPSQANFLWVRGPTPSEKVFAELSAQGILVRSFHARGGRLSHCLRVTLGTPGENDAFFSAYQKLV